MALFEYCRLMARSSPSSTTRPRAIIITRVHSDSTMPIWCVDSRTVCPAAAQSRMTPMTSRGADRIEARQRLVEDDDVRTGEERRGNLHLLLVALRQLLDFPRRPRRRGRAARASAPPRSARRRGSCP